MKKFWFKYSLCLLIIKGGIVLFFFLLVLALGLSAELLTPIGFSVDTVTLEHETAWVDSLGFVNLGCVYDTIYDTTWVYALPERIVHRPDDEWVPEIAKPDYKGGIAKFDFEYYPTGRGK